MDREKDLLLELINADVYITAQNLEKIIMELIDNAFKFSEKDSLVKVVSTIKNDATYEIKIIDRGRGMSQSQIKNIGVYMQFERKVYEQQGSGFGITISKRLAEMHNGKLNISSKYGEYTEVNVSLRLVKSKP